MAKTGTLDILHVEDNPAHAELVRRALRKSGLDCDIRLVMSFDEYTRALDQGAPDVVLSDNRGLDFDGIEALRLAQRRYPKVPFLFVCSSFESGAVAGLKAAGAADCVLKQDLSTLSRVIRRVLPDAPRDGERPKAARRNGTPESGLDFQRLFEQSPDILLVLKPDAPRFTMVGATQARLAATHTTRGQIVGKGLFELFPDNPDDPAATGARNLRASLERVLATRQPDTMAVQKYDIRGEDGSFQVKYWSPRNLPVLSDAGEILYILHRVEDVTELVQASEVGEELRDRTQAMEREVIARSRELAEANRGLRDANTKLGELDAAKTAFFSNISHEFRTPLTLLLGPVEDMLRGSAAGMPAEERQRLELIHHNALRLLKLVNALLDFSRIEAGRMGATYAPTDIAQRTRELVSAFDSAAVKAGLKLEIGCPPLSEPAYVDTDMWEKIVLNLVSNAFKFTFEGGIGVRLDEDAAHFRLTVRDTGTGIPAEQLPRVFERFHRVEGARSRSHEGTGIGLSLVQELVKLHGGSIAVESTPGKGSAFTVILPKGRAHLPDDAVAEAGPERQAGLKTGAFVGETLRWLPGGDETAVVPASESSQGRVLLVDDNADMRGYVAALLKPYYRVEEAVDGEMALQHALVQPPDLVVSDVMMPRLDGFGLLRALRASPRTRGVPVILLSARAGEESSVEGLEAGADDYLIKPFAARELLARVRTHLELAQARSRWAGELEQLNQELEAFSYSVSHDLRGPLRSISGFTQLVLEDYGDKLDYNGRRFLEYIRGGTHRMSELIDALLELARITRVPLKRGPVDLSALASKLVEDMRQRDPERDCTVKVQPGLWVEGDARLVGALLTNLLENAWKFTAKRAGARIEVGSIQADGETAFYVRDDGAGFDMKAAGKLFTPFQRQHTEEEFEGTGIGLATVQRIVRRHGGRVWAESAPGQGAAFFFTLGRA